MKIDLGKCALCEKSATSSINLAAGAAAVVPIHGTGFSPANWSPRCQAHSLNPDGFCTNPKHAALLARLDAYAALAVEAQKALVLTPEIPNWGALMAALRAATEGEGT